MPGLDNVKHELSAQCQTLLSDPSARIDEHVFQNARHFLVPALAADEAAGDEISLFISLLARVLPGVLVAHTEPETESVVSLLAELVKHASFEGIVESDLGHGLAQGLDMRTPPSVNHVVLTALDKARQRTSDVARVASMPDVVRAFITLMLSTQDTGVAQKAIQTLVAMLEVDLEASEVPVHGVGNRGGGQGLLWRRIFGDKEIYELLYQIPSFNTRQDPPLSRLQKTVAQSRLLLLLPKIGNLDWNYIIRSHHPDIEQRHGLTKEEGLLQFAVLHLVDTSDDILMAKHMMEFYSDLIATVRRPSTVKNESVSLQFLREHGIHEQACLHWIEPERSGDMFSYGSSASYISTYVSCYPESFLARPLAPKVRKRLAQAMDIAPSQWKRTSPTWDLHVLSSVPRILLLPQSRADTNSPLSDRSPILSIPSRAAASEDALNTLAYLFHGPDDKGEQRYKSAASLDESVAEAEAAAARALLVTYLCEVPDLGDQLVQRAETVALPEVGIAATRLIASIIGAKWAPLPDSSASTLDEAPATLQSLPSDSMLVSLLPANSPVWASGQPFPATGLTVILSSLFRNSVIPFLLRDPIKFNNQIPGGRGDPTNAVSRMAMAKWDALNELYRELRANRALVEEDDFAQLILASAGKRIREGPWGDVSGAGSRVATLDL